MSNEKDVRRFVLEISEHNIDHVSAHDDQLVIRIRGKRLILNELESIKQRSTVILDQRVGGQI